MADKLSFRKGKRLTGLAGVASPHSTTFILLGGRVVGQITPPTSLSSDYTWSVGLTVRTDVHPGWKWIRFKKRFREEPEARQWVKENFSRMVDASPVHQFEESHKPWQS